MMSEAGRTNLESVEPSRGIIRRVPEFSSGTKIEVIVADSLVKVVMNDILNILCEGSFASGKIYVSDIMEAYDIEQRKPVRHLYRYSFDMVVLFT